MTDTATRTNTASRLAELHKDSAGYSPTQINWWSAVCRADRHRHEVIANAIDGATIVEGGKGPLSIEVKHRPPTGRLRRSDSTRSAIFGFATGTLGWSVGTYPAGDNPDHAYDGWGRGRSVEHGESDLTINDTAAVIARCTSVIAEMEQK